MLRTVILPISWPIAYRSSIRQKKMVRLQPELQRLKLECSEHPSLCGTNDEVIPRTRNHGGDWRSVLGSLVQMPLFLGMYQDSSSRVNGARFLWWKR